MSDDSADLSEGGQAPTQGAAPVGRRAAIALLGVVVIVLAVILAVGFAPKGRPIGGVLPADPTGYAAPAVSLPTLFGKDLALADLQGKPVVLNFWASWCVTCIAESAILGEAERKWRSRGVVFIGMDSSDTNDAALTFMRKYGMEYDSFIDAKGLQTPLWGVTGYPETFFIGADGRIRGKYVSAIDRKTLDERIRQLLQG